MQLADDNFDDLLQRAAEEYPLKTDSADWEIVSVRLGESTWPQRIRRDRKWQSAILLLLLIPTAFFIIVNHQGNSTTGSESAASQEQKVPPSDEGNTAGDQSQAVNSVPHDKISNAFSVTQRNSRSGALPFDINNEIDQFDNSLPVSDQQTQLSQVLPSQNTLPYADQNNLSKDGGIKQDADPRIPISVQKNVTEIPKENTTRENADAETRIRLLSQPKTFYGSFFVGPQLSTVKFQHVDKLGYRIGIALGYRINSRFNVEIGVQRENKHFFSDGKYFDRSALKLKESTSIETLNGSAVLTDIPVGIRYNFRAGNKGQFFVTGGFSAVLVTHSEQYEYAVTRDGTPDNLTRSYGSMATTKYFSSFNASAGYEAPIGTLLKLRIEPYYQTHIQGFGIGDLPLNSFGVSVGIVKDFK